MTTNTHTLLFPDGFKKVTLMTSDEGIPNIIISSRGSLAEFRGWLNSGQKLTQLGSYASPTVKAEILLLDGKRDEVFIPNPSPIASLIKYHGKYYGLKKSYPELPEFSQWLEKHPIHGYSF